MRFFKRIILFLTLAISSQIMLAQADEDPASQESLSCVSKNSITLSEDINNRLSNLHEESAEESAEELAVFNSDNKSLFISKSDVNLMAQIVYSESKGEPYEGKVAVASVILNRVISPKFPNSIEGVIFQPRAFSCVVDGKINSTPNEECYNAVYDAIKGLDPTNNALFFYNPTIATCSWMKNVEKKDTKQIGNHVFFNA